MAERELTDEELDALAPAVPVEAPAPEAPSAAAPAEQMGKGAAAGLGVLEALSAGFAPKMHGLAKSLLGGVGGVRAKLGPAFQPEPGDTPEVAAFKRQKLAEEAAQPSQYDINRGAYERLTEKAAAERPGAYYGGQIGTGAAQALGAGLLAPARAAAAIAPSLLRRIGVGAAEGFAQGGLSGAGHSQADLSRLSKDEVLQLLKDTGIGAGAGAILGGGLPAAGAAARGIGRGVANFAREQAPEWALKAAGGIQKDFKSLGEDARAYGQFLLDQGMLPFAGSKQAVLNRLRGLQTQAGQTIGENLDVNRARPDIVGALQQMRGDVAALEPTTRRLQGPTRAALMGDVMEKFGATAPDEAVQTATRNLSARELNNTKRAIDELVNWRPTSASEAQTSQGARAIANRIRGEEYATAARGLTPEQNAAFRQAMQQYGPASDLINYAEQGVAREGGNTLLGLVAPIIAGSAGIGVGSAVGGGEGIGAGLGTVAALTALKRRGPAAFARILDSIARAEGGALNPARLPPSVLRALAASGGLAAPAERALAPAIMPQRQFAPMDAYLTEGR